MLGVFLICVNIFILTLIYLENISKNLKLFMNKCKNAQELEQLEFLLQERKKYIINHINTFRCKSEMDDQLLAKNLMKFEHTSCEKYNYYMVKCVHIFTNFVSNITFKQSLYNKLYTFSIYSDEKLKIFSMEFNTTFFKEHSLINNQMYLDNVINKEKLETLAQYYYKCNPIDFINKLLRDLYKNKALVYCIKL